MSIVDFKEIPMSKPPSSAPDDFELFARDFFEVLGYEIIRSPYRGQDSGADLIIRELRQGISGESAIDWLVSCKHFTHSGRSVCISDEQDISDRVKSANCDGFIGFYSTLPSSGLIAKLEGLERGEHQIDHQIYDYRRIENKLIQSYKAKELFSRYFPVSYQKWSKNNPEIPDLSLGNAVLRCRYCGKDLIKEQSPDLGMFVIWTRLPASILSTSIEEHTEDLESETSILSAYTCCKGECDRRLQKRWGRHDTYDSWFELLQFTIPSMYIESIHPILVMLSVYSIESDEVLDSIYNFLRITFHYVARDLTDEEKKRFRIGHNL